MRRRWLGGGLLVGALAASGGMYVAATGDSGEAGGGSTMVDTGTVMVTRGDLVVHETFEGRLGYRGQRQIVGRLAGTVTYLPATGSVVERGERLAAIDREPIFLMYGRLPAYRTLTIGGEGPDVLQLERNLAALGYGGGFEVDDTYTYYTAAAVEEWQEDEGLDETGDVTLGSVVFASGPLRMAKAEARVGDVVGPSQALISVSSDRQAVEVDVPVRKLEMIRKSRKVTVSMPDGSSLSATVAKVGSVVEISGGDGEDEATVAVVVRLGEGLEGQELDSTPVDVRFESERRKDVLTVPVNALVADPDGGYAVVAVEDGSRRTIPVETGAFSQGRVEVVSDQLREDMLVEVPV